MVKPFAVTLAIAAGTGFGCTIIPTTYQIDTLSAGTVQVVATFYTYSNNPPPITVPTGQGVYGPYLQADLKSHLESGLRDSALVFIARIDSLVSDTTGMLSPEVKLAAIYPETGSVQAWIRARIRVDTLIRGELPGKIFWIRTPMLNSGLCGIGWDPFLGKAFLNISNGLVNASSIKLPYQMFGFYNAAYWFDGRYLVAPEFPGLRQDITEIYPDYPATGILATRYSKIPLRPDGKAYRPDGRMVSEGVKAGTSPVPLLR